MTQGERRNISATVGCIQMYTCSFDKREQTLSQILGPSEMSLNCSSTDSHSDKFQINLGTFSFRLAPDTIELFMGILSCLSTEERKNSKETSHVQDWSHLWTPKPIDFKALPGLNIDTGEVAEETLASMGGGTSYQERTLGGEDVRLELECLLVTLEAGSGVSSIPLLKLQAESSFHAQGFYSHKVRLSFLHGSPLTFIHFQIKFDGHYSLEVAYFNPRQAVWEPLLEPVSKTSSDGSPKQLPWVQTFEGHYFRNEYDMSGLTSPTTSSIVSDFDDLIEVDLPPPMFKIQLNATDPLEFTVTKTFVEVSDVLSKSFVEAYKAVAPSIRHVPKAPYKLINKTGLALVINLQGAGLKTFETSDSHEETQVFVSAGSEMELFDRKIRGQTHRRHSSLVAECQVALDKTIAVCIPEMENASCYIPLTKADKRFFKLSRDSTIGLVSSVSLEQGCKVVTLSSCVSVKVRNQKS